MVVNEEGETLPSATVLSESAVPKRVPKNVKPDEGAVVKGVLELCL